MQQTNKYELNKPGLDDPVAIAPLNENMDKLEAALIAEAKSRADADAEESSARTAAIQAEAAARVSAVNAEISARTAAVNAEASARANADTTETNARVAADKAEAKTRADADTKETNARIAAVNAEATARTNADNALSARIQTLEAKRIAYGVLTVNPESQTTVTLGFSPFAVLVHYTGGTTGFTCLALATQRGAAVEITGNTFKVDSGSGYSIRSGPHTYLALG